MESTKVISAKGERIITLEDLIKAYDIDKDIYEVLKFKANVYEGQQKDNNNEPVILQLHQVSAEFKPIREVINYRDILLDVFGEGIKAKRSKMKKEGDSLLVIPHFDLHIDKFANGTQQYLDDISNKTYDILNIGRKNGAERVLYINGGDYFNSDGKYKTTKGTEQFNSMTEKDSFKYGLRDQIQLIETISKEMPVDVMYLSGNHDDLKLQALSDAIDIYFSHDGRVNVDSEDKYRKYYDWGNTSIGAGHGDGVKDKDLLSVYSIEHGLNENNVYMKGHIHHRLTQMFGNLIVETFGTPSNPGERDKKMGYISKGKISGQLFDKKHGKYAEFSK